MTVSVCLPTSSLPWTGNQGFLCHFSFQNDRFIFISGCGVGQGAKASPVERLEEKAEKADDVFQDAVQEEDRCPAGRYPQDQDLAAGLLVSQVDQVLLHDDGGTARAKHTDRS